MAHIHEKIDFTTGVYVVNDNAVLLRKHEKYHMWLHLGGHVELDEDPNECAVREAKEESGLDVRLIGTTPPENTIEGPGFRHIIAPAFMNMHYITQTDVHQHCDFIYFATSLTRELNPHEDEKLCDMRWFTREDLENPEYELLPSVAFYAKAALDTLAP